MKKYPLAHDPNNCILQRRAIQGTWLILTAITPRKEERKNYPDD
jgi:hypothetical protein